MQKAHGQGNSAQQRPSEQKLDDLILPAPEHAKTVIIGAGAYGTALAHLLTGARAQGARVGDVTILTRRQEVADSINHQRQNPNKELKPALRELMLAPEVRATTCPKEAFKGADYAVIAVPSQALEGLVLSFDSMDPSTVVASTVKSILPMSTQHPAQTPLQFLKRRLQHKGNPLAFLGGPGFAHDLVTAGPVKRLVAASDNNTIATRVAELFTGGELVVKSHHNPHGVEIGCAMKNFGALVMGVANELQFDEKSKSKIFHEVFLEMLSLIQAASPTGRLEAGRLSAVHADLFLTLTGASRNVMMGEALVKNAGRFRDARELAQRLELTAEGLNATEGALCIAKQHGKKLILVEAMARILSGENPRKVMDKAMNQVEQARAERRDATKDIDKDRLDFQKRLMSLFPLARGILEGMQAAPQERGVVFNLALRELRRGVKLFDGSFERDALSGPAHEKLFRIFHGPLDGVPDKSAAVIGRALGMRVPPQALREMYPDSIAVLGVLIERLTEMQESQNEDRIGNGREPITFPFVEVMSRIIHDGALAPHTLRDLIRDDGNVRECRPKHYKLPYGPRAGDSSAEG